MDSSESVNTPSLRKIETALIVGLLVQTAVGIWCAVSALSLPVSINGVTILSLSIIKWATVAFGIIAAEVVIMWLLAISVFPEHRARVEKTHNKLMQSAGSTQLIMGLITIMLGVPLLLPGAAWGSIEFSFMIFRPILVWLFFGAAIYFLVTLVYKTASDYIFDNSGKDQKKIGWIFSAFIFLFIWLTILETGMGVANSQDYLTASPFFMFLGQLLVSMAAVAFVWQLLRLIGKKPGIYKNILNILVLVSAAVTLWISRGWAGTPGSFDLSPIRLVVIGLWVLVHLYMAFQNAEPSLARFLNSLRKDRGWWIGLSILVGIVFLLMALFGIGTSGGQPYWYGAGVPLLFEQILYCIAIVLILKEWSGKLADRLPVLRNHPDLFICIALFVFTAVMWALQPQQTSFFTPGPYPPSNEYQPFADSAYYDQQSQTALLGSGLNGGQYLDRPLYPALLTYLHLLGGQSFATVMALQAILLALMVMGIYGVGKLLHSRLAGALTALFVAVQGWNAIFTVNSVNAASPIQMLTEYPTAVLLVFATLCFISAIRGSRLRWVWLALCGALLGLGSLMRTNVLVVALAFLVLPFFFLRKLRLSAFAVSGMILAAFFLAILPWGLRNVSVGADSIFTMYTSKIDHVISQRYNSPGGFTPSGDGVSDSSAAVGTGADTSAAIGMAYDDPSAAIGVSADPSAAIGACSPTPMPGGEPTESGEPAQPTLIQQLLPSGYRVVNHFFHNLAMSAFMFPIDWSDSSLVKTFSGNTYWQDGMALSVANGMDIVLLVVNLLVITLGIALLTRKTGLLGWVPLVIFLGYHASNALALVSGGRHLTETDWVLVFYFGIGLLQLGKAAGRSIHADISDPEPTQPRVNTKTFTRTQNALLAGTALIGALLIGVLVPLSEHLVPNRVVAVNDPRILQDWWNFYADKESTFDVMPFIVDNPSVIFVEGNLLYPRYFDQGEPIYLNCAVLFEPQNQLTFTLAGPQQYQVTMPLAELPESLQSGSSAILLACPEEGNQLRALALLLPGSGIEIFADLDSFHCP